MDTNYVKFSRSIGINPPEKVSIPIDHLNEIKESQNNKSPIITIIKNCERLNVRQKPTKTSNVLCILNKNDVVEIESSTGEWTFIRVLEKKHYDINGYVLTKFLSGGNNDG